MKEKQNVYFIFNSFSLNKFDISYFEINKENS